MTSPLITVDPNETISVATRRMRQLNIRRLGIMYKGDLIGVVSSKDILAVTPELIEILQERVRINSIAEEPPQDPPLTGYCEKCSRWSDTLNEGDGIFLCEECRIELEVE